MVHIICYIVIRKQKWRMTIAEAGIIIDIVLPPRAIRLLFGTGFVSVRHSQAFRREDAEYLQITACYLPLPALMHISRAEKRKLCQIFHHQRSEEHTSELQSQR